MNIEEIKMDHFENFEELIKTCKMWIIDDDIHAYYRFFEFNCMKTLVTAYEKEKEKNKTQPDCAEPIEKTEEMVNMRWVNHRFISKDKLKEILGIEETDSEKILSLLQTLVDENARLEDIEDRKVQIEYNNVFNKGVKSVEDKIKIKIKEQDETKLYWTDEVKDILKSLLRKEQ